MTTRITCPQCIGEGIVDHEDEDDAGCPYHYWSFCRDCGGYGYTWVECEPSAMADACYSGRYVCLTGGDTWQGSGCCPAERAAEEWSDLNWFAWYADNYDGPDA